MKRMKYVILALCCCFFFAVTACGNKTSRVPDEKKMVEDINTSGLFLDYVAFDSVTVLRQQTNEESKTFFADVEFHGKDTYAEYTGSVRLKYNYYDSDKWMLDDYSDIKYDYHCIQTRNLDDVSRDIAQNSKSYLESIIISDEGKQGSIDSLSVHNVELVMGFDNVEEAAVTWTSTLGFAQVEYLAFLDFEYSKGKWTYLNPSYSEVTNVEIVGLNGASFKNYEYSFVIEEISTDSLVVSNPNDGTFYYYGDASENADLLLMGSFLHYSAGRGPVFYQIYDYFEFDRIHLMHICTESPTIELFASEHPYRHSFLDLQSLGE